MFCKRHCCFENGEEERVGRRDGDEADWPNEPVGSEMIPFVYGVLV